jgi:hypothetical protein
MQLSCTLATVGGDVAGAAKQAEALSEVRQASAAIEEAVMCRLKSAASQLICLKRCNEALLHQAAQQHEAAGAIRTFVAVRTRALAPPAAFVRTPLVPCLTGSTRTYTSSKNCTV